MFKVTSFFSRSMPRAIPATRIVVADNDKRHGTSAWSFRAPIAAWIMEQVATSVMTPGSARPIQTSRGVANIAYPNPTVLCNIPAKKMMPPAPTMSSISMFTIGVVDVGLTSRQSTKKLLILLFNLFSFKRRVLIKDCAMGF